MTVQIINNFVKCPECDTYYPLSDTGEEEKERIEKVGMCCKCEVVKEKKDKKAYKIEFIKCSLCGDSYQDEHNKTYIKDFKSCRKCIMKRMKSIGTETMSNVKTARLIKLCEKKGNKFRKEI